MQKDLLIDSFTDESTLYISVRNITELETILSTITKRKESLNEALKELERFNLKVTFEQR